MDAALECDADELIGEVRAAFEHLHASGTQRSLELFELSASALVHCSGVYRQAGLGREGKRCQAAALMLSSRWQERLLAKMPPAELRALVDRYARLARRVLASPASAAEVILSPDSFPQTEVLFELLSCARSQAAGLERASALELGSLRLLHSAAALLEQRPQSACLIDYHCALWALGHTHGHGERWRREMARRYAELAQATGIRKDFPELFSPELFAA